MTPPETLPDDVAALQTALTAERTARQQAEARASGAEAMVAHLKLLIAKMKRDRFGQSSERGRKLLDQLELQLEELEASAAEDEVAAEAAEPDPTPVRGFTRQKPVRAPVAGSSAARARGRRRRRVACPCCGGKLVKLGEDVTETLEVVPRQWKVIQTVREKFTCRSCETITQPPAPFHAIARGTGRAEPVGDDPLCQVRRASAAQSAERDAMPAKASSSTCRPWRIGSAPAPRAWRRSSS